MSTKLKQLRSAIQDFAWDTVFRTSLKWTKPTDQVRTEELAGVVYTLRPIADTGGMQVYLVRAADGALPPPAIRRMLETRLRRTQVEHLLIFEDAAQTHAVLQWVKAGQGRRVREFAYRRGESGEALLQRLQGMAFTLDDFDAQGQIEISKVTARVAKNLDVEQVTKKFYDEFKRQRELFHSFLQGIPLASDQRWYVSVMLNRLMFIYFVQAKGFLNYDLNYLRERLTWSQANLGVDRYYRDFLRVLFFEGFACEPAQRSAATNQMLGTIPYLNGGLFLPHPLEDRYGAALDIPDRAFEQLFDFFSGWRWHLNERPGTSDKEIDPDVLGYIFEKYINQKQMGAYYTRDDITGYICRNTIIPALCDKAGLDLAPLNLPQSITTYIYPAMLQSEPLPTETERELAARRARVATLVAEAQAGKLATINAAVTANLDLETMLADLIPRLAAPKLYALYTALAGDPHAGQLPLSILDPTVGSGAFLFAALRILKPIYEALLERMDELVTSTSSATAPLAEPVEAKRRSPELFRANKTAAPSRLSAKESGLFREVLAAVAAHANRDYFITKSIVVRNLYGVDLMAEATEICKLRLFLRMVADLDDARHIEPLPDIDFNIRAGNALVGYAHPDEIGLVFKDKIAGMSPRQQKLLEEIRTVERELSSYRNAQLQFNPSAAAGRSARDAIRTRLDAINTGLDTDLLKIGQLHKEADGGYNTQPFHWFTAFYNIIEAGGFDVIVGNPPYVEYSKVRGDRRKDGEDRYKIYGYKTESCGNLYAFITERCTTLLHSQGRFSFIVPIALPSTDRMQVLRIILAKNKSLHHVSFSTRPSKLFEGAEQRLTIFIQSPSEKEHLWSGGYLKWSNIERDVLFQSIEYIFTHMIYERNHIWPKLRGEVERNIFNKILENKPLSLTGMLVDETFLYYKNTGLRYFNTVTLRPPQCWINGVATSSSRETTLGVKMQYRHAIHCLLLSTTFFMYYQFLSNCRDLNPSDINLFPTPINLNTEKLNELSLLIEQDYTKKGKLIRMQNKLTGLVELESLTPAKSKPILDEIDRVLAAHYGFTAEELDFIINYDIKYRMGRGGAEEGEE